MIQAGPTMYVCPCGSAVWRAGGWLVGAAAPAALDEAIGDLDAHVRSGRA